MKFHTKIAAASILTVVVGSMAMPAMADAQNVNATLGSSVSMTASPADIASGGWTLANTGANTTSGGTVAINSNAPYTVSVSADKTRMTEYGSGAYIASSPKALTSALTVTATRASGSATVPGVGAAAVVGTSTLLGTGTGLGTDSYTLSFSQPTLITDSALPSTEVYHIVLTYTAASTLG